MRQRGLAMNREANIRHTNGKTLKKKKCSPKQRRKKEKMVL